MSYPTKLVWGRVGKDEQVRRFMVQVSKIIENELHLPATPHFNITSKIRELVEEWEPLEMMWYPIREDAE